MRYRLEWNQGSYESNDWKRIEAHPMFLDATAFERTSIGLVAL